MTDIDSVGRTAFLVSEVRAEEAGADPRLFDDAYARPFSSPGARAAAQAAHRLGPLLWAAPGGAGRAGRAGRMAAAGGRLRRDGDYRGTRPAAVPGAGDGIAPPGGRAVAYWDRRPAGAGARGPSGALGARHLRGDGEGPA